MLSNLPIKPAYTISLIGLLFLVAVAVAFTVRGAFRAPPAPEPEWEVIEGDPEQGKVAIRHYGCASCHVIPGIRGSKARVGPRLNDIGEQSYIAGVLRNEPENMVRWIRNPPGVNPLTAMPYLGVTEDDARDIAAYLYTMD